MSARVSGLLALGLISSSTLAHAEGAESKPPAPKSQPGKSAKPAPASAASGASTPAAAGPSPSATPSAPPQKQTAEPSEPAPPSEVESIPASPSTPPPASSAPAVPPGVQVYMRSGREPLQFSVRATNSHGTPNLCSAPCDAKLAPGDYQLRLNGVMVEGPIKLSRPGTLEGKLDSREASREGGWLALNVGGILGGVFITVAALGGPSWTYAAGGGSLLSGGVIFALAYRADRASVSFVPSEPADVRGLPPPAPTDNHSSGPTPNASLELRERSGFGARTPGLGVRVTF